MTYSREDGIEDLRAAIQQYGIAYDLYKEQGFEQDCVTVMRLADDAKKRLAKLEHGKEN